MNTRTIRFAAALGAAAALTAACAGNDSAPGAVSASGSARTHATDEPAQTGTVEPADPGEPPERTAEPGQGGATGQAAAPEQGEPTVQGGDGSHAARRSLTFIAMGDDQPQGTPVGCGDTAVDVPFTTTTIAPLGEVYRAELSSHNEHYADTGLYNALYRSDLAYDGADITDGHATVHLSGDLLMGGECDIPRVRAQLTEPALQFDNVDSVTVLVNGESLEDVLSLRN